MIANAITMLSMCYLDFPRATYSAQTTIGKLSVDLNEAKAIISRLEGAPLLLCDRYFCTINPQANMSKHNNFQVH
jgi:hypothetical protein